MSESSHTRAPDPAADPAADAAADPRSLPTAPDPDPFSAEPASTAPAPPVPTVPALTPAGGPGSRPEAPVPPTGGTVTGGAVSRAGDRRRTGRVAYAPETQRTPAVAVGPLVTPAGLSSPVLPVTPTPPPAPRRRPGPGSSVSRRIRGWQLRYRLRRRADQLLDALSCVAVMEGVVGSFLLVLGSLSPAFLPRTSAAGGDLFPPWVGTVLLLVGTSLMLDGWFRLRPGRHARTSSGVRPRFWAVLALWSAPLLVGPPLLSSDAYAYAAQGWVLANGLDPYQMGPAALPGPWADQVDPIWLDTPTPYGPLSLYLQYLTVAITGGNVYAAAWGMRWWVMIGVALLVFCVPRIAVRLGLDPLRATWIGVMNPIVLLHLVGGAHNDGLMVGLVALALLLAVRRQLFWAAVAVGLAAAVKQPAALTALPVAVLYLRPVIDEDGPARGWPTGRQLAAFGWTIAITVATFWLVSARGFGFGWIEAMGVPGGAMTLSPFSLIGAGLQWVLSQLALYTAADASLAVMRLTGTAVALAIVAWLALRVGSRKPMTFLVASFLALVVCGPAMHAWYLLWAGVLVGLLPYRAIVWRISIWLVVFWVCYAVADVAARNQAPALALAALAVSLAQVIYDEHTWRPAAVRDRLVRP